MPDAILFLVLLAVWIALQTFVLPRMGVGT